MARRLRESGPLIPRSFVRQLGLLLKSSGSIRHEDDVLLRSGWVVRSRLCSVAMTIYVASEAFKVCSRPRCFFYFLAVRGMPFWVDCDSVCCYGGRCHGDVYGGSTSCGEVEASARLTLCFSAWGGPALLDLGFMILSVCILCCMIIFSLGNTTDGEISLFCFNILSFLHILATMSAFESVMSHIILIIFLVSVLSGVIYSLMHGFFCCSGCLILLFIIANACIPFSSGGESWYI
ncbi:unnamed protein product [Musa acuminata subsp. malaccensis]|uniref:(wild Malaysian banana) hypothetical protein n=1 Tax=Musa acuminata subsp. malaccensis TaxID=214687 RepID=A0A804KFN3_MUSAM|nr:unnamed protein product [Musa acuminata subsp. malaccensis]